MTFNPKDFGAVEIKNFNPADFGAVSTDKSQMTLAHSQGMIDKMRMEAKQAELQAQQAAKPATIAKETAKGTIGTLFDPLIKAGRTAVQAVGEAFGAKEPVEQYTNIAGEPAQTLQADVAGGKSVPRAAGEFALETATVAPIGKAASLAKEGIVKGAKIATPVVKSILKKTGITDFFEQRAIKKAEEKALKQAEENAGFIKRAILGKEGVKTLKELNNPEAKAFLSPKQGGGGKTFSKVADDTEKSITKMEEDSIKNFNTVIDKVPNTPISKEQLALRVNDSLARSVTNLTDKTMGVTPQELGIKTIGDLKGRVSTEEFNTLKTIQSTIEKWPNKSAFGLVKLRRNLQGLYKEGNDASNRAISEVNKELKEMISESIPDVKIKDAYKSASDNIDRIEEIKRGLMGKDTISGETKLASIARGLKNPAQNAEKIAMIQELEKATGQKILSQLKGYQDFLDLLRKDFPTVGDVYKTGAKRVAITAGVTGGAVAGGEKLLGD